MTERSPLILGNLSGVARPGGAMRARLGRLHPERYARLESILDDAVAIDAFARLLTEAIEKNTTKDGRIDMRDVAVHVLAEMKRHPR